MAAALRSHPTSLLVSHDDGSSGRLQRRRGLASLSFASAAAFSSSLLGDLLCRDIWGKRYASVAKDVDSRSFTTAINSLLTDVADDFMTLQSQDPPKPVANPKTVASIILGGGAGTRLFPLTRMRAKPAVPIGGCYRLIDVPMSNCINSGINKIYVLTQFNSQSLNRHLARTYNLGNGVNFGDGFVEVLAATQTPGEDGKKWFQGTADAVRQFVWLFEDAKLRHIENILILSGDHLYRMDYMDFLQKHIATGADISVSCVPVDGGYLCSVMISNFWSRCLNNSIAAFFYLLWYLYNLFHCATSCSRASDYGLIKIDGTGRIHQFLEKPKGESLKTMQVDTTVLGLSPEDAKNFPYIASMGIYLFKTDVLLKLLRWRYPHSNDFGSEIIPKASQEYNVQAYLFNGYWEDIGTIKSFFDANLALADQPAKFRFFDPSKPIFTSPRFLPSSKIERSRVLNSIVSHGCFLRECTVEHSIVGVRSRLECGTELVDTMMMGADYYQTEAEIASILAEGKVPVGVGRNTRIRNCIIDKNAKIGKDVVIANADNVEEAERPSEGFYIRSGITVVMKNATIPDGAVI